MAFDFDEVVERRGTHSVKWDGMKARFGLDDPDLIPMWVADMDFRSPPAVGEAIRALCDNGVHGYFGDDADYKAAITGWMRDRHGWEVDPGWIGSVHGLVAGIGLCVQALTEPGDGVAVFSPVYHMFSTTVRAAGRVLIESPLREVQGRYEMDLDDLLGRVDARTKMVLLCSPHNPGGRVWSVEELRALAAFCAERDLILVSDEIHHDLVFSEATHTVTAAAAPEIADRLVTLTAPTKTFNIAGALTGNVIAADDVLRDRLNRTRAGFGAGAVNRFGVIAATAAYAEGAPWLDALVPYLQANRDHLQDAVARHMPGVRAMPLEATYLAWLDFRGTGLSPEEARAKVEGEAKIVVNKGPTFGEGGTGWLRFNFACPRPTLDRAIERLAQAFR